MTDARLQSTRPIDDEIPFDDASPLDRVEPTDEADALVTPAAARRAPLLPVADGDVDPTERTSDDAGLADEDPAP